MVKIKELDKIYDEVIIGNEITTKLLNSFGFNSKAIKSLVEDGTLIRIKRGLYTVSVEKLFYYGKRLVYTDYDKSKLCFLRCLQLEPKHQGACFQLFLKSIQEENYQLAFEYFEGFYYNTNKYYNSDSNFYLYLLSHITEIPYKHREFVKYIELSDIIVSDNDLRYGKSISDFNVVRELAFQKRFMDALKKLNTINSGDAKLQSLVMKTLLTKANEAQRKVDNQILQLVSNDDISGLISYLRPKNEQNILSLREKYALILAEDILNIQKYKRFEFPRPVKTNSVYKAIAAFDYELAFSIIKEKVGDNQKSYIYLLLKKINSLIFAIKNKKYFEFVDKKYEEIKASGKDSIILEPLNNNEFNRILSVIIRHPNLDLIKIGENGNQQVILRSFEYNSPYDNLDTKLNEILDLYYNKHDLEGVIEEINTCLSYRLNASVLLKLYRILSLAYQDLNNKEYANYYSMMANGLLEKYGSISSQEALNDFLMMKKISEFKNGLKLYLAGLGKEAYESLILSMVKQNINDGDFTFSKPLTLIEKLKDKDYELDIQECIQEFYAAISQNNFEVARGYLNVLAKLSDMDDTLLSKEDFEKLLSVTENALANQKSQEATDMSIEKSEMSVDESKDAEEYIDTHDEDLEEYIDLLCFKLIDGEVKIAVLDAVSLADEKKIFEILKYHPDIRAFTTDSLIPQIVLVHVKDIPNKDLKNSFSKFKTDYINKNYLGCIELAHDVISRIKKNGKYAIFICNALADSYTQLGKPEIGYAYLAVSKSFTESIEEKLASNKDFEYFKKYYEFMISKGLTSIIIPITGNVDIHNAYLFANYSNLDSNIGLWIIDISTPENPAIILKKSIKDFDYDNIKSYTEIKNLFYDCMYSECISKAEEYLTHNNKICFPVAYVYEILGKCYIRKGKANVGMEYLKIAFSMYKLTDNMRADYVMTYLVKPENSPSEIKQASNIQLSEFEYTLDYYGIDEIEKIAHLVCGSGVSVHDACQMFNLNSEQECLINLILARDCYMEELYAKGDKYLKDVERFKGKTDLVKKVYDDVVRNKKFFKNRKSGGYKSLVNLPVKVDSGV